MRTFDHPDERDLSLDRVLAALADPHRRSIVRRLASGGAEQSCSQFDLLVSKSTQTHHFRVLREAGIIRQRYVGTSVMNSLRADELPPALREVVDAVVRSETGSASR